MSRPVGVNSEDTKKLIEDKATKMFELKGYSATSISDIKTETQLSKGTVYYHFKNKEELYLYCLKQALNKFINEWKKGMVREKSATDKLYLWAHLCSLELHNPLIKTIPEYMVSTNKDQIFVVKLLKPELDVLTEIIQEGIEKKEFNAELNIQEVSVILLSLISGLHDTSIALIGFNTQKDKADLYRKATETVINGIGIK
ncbi:TetR/AcrR family transcriptional regulator [Alkalihalophilus pseudofirmus]|uniref:TetR/AcrR family transcriptional regulator n=1 Tax=Alkalihalophilus pseudofirmus TaxID=79885 RepID=UPI00259B259B|nr:TetR/AcrR family transcriptional regulator [Alkalihalophilus pseudofirmus]WEG18906.1 TetR/AcrR family transcriptional regulator [Alkalihalophilus pseudofirmus]